MKDGNLREKDFISWTKIVILIKEK